MMNMMSASNTKSEADRTQFAKISKKEKGPALSVWIAAPGAWGEYVAKYSETVEDREGKQASTVWRYWGEMRRTHGAAELKQLVKYEIYEVKKRCERQQDGEENRAD